MTELNYLHDTYVFESKAIIKKIANNKDGTAIALDQTIFYPQGGGQPGDIGVISKKKSAFFVKNVRLDEKGIVWHFGEFQQGEFQKGDEVILRLDSEKRMLHARLHSAGHLLDCALIELGISYLTPTKGYHFEKGSYVEYKGVINNPSKIILDLEKKVNQLVDKDLIIEKQILTHAEAKELGIDTPESKPARIVKYKGFSFGGCGGTHINSSKEIGKIIIRKIKTKKESTRISYNIQL